jgi:hypothetical protein
MNFSFEIEKNKSEIKIIPLCKRKTSSRGGTGRKLFSLFIELYVHHFPSIGTRYIPGTNIVDISLIEKIRHTMLFPRRGELI